MSKMKKNLLSISQLTKLGNFVIFDPKKIKVCWKVKIVDTLIMEGQKVDSIYVMSIKKASSQQTLQHAILPSLKQIEEKLQGRFGEQREERKKNLE